MWKRSGQIILRVSEIFFWAGIREINLHKKIRKDLKMISTDVCRKQVVSEVRNYTEFPKLEKKWKLRESLDEASGEPAKFCYEVAKNFARVLLMKIYKKLQNESW